jgi:putative tricarboxylic transport membrane protein
VRVIKAGATRSRLEGLAIMLVALGYLWEAHNVPDLYHVPGVPGPTTFPYILGIVFALTGLWLLLSPADLLARRRQAAEQGGEAEAPPRATGSVVQWVAGNWHFYAMWAVILGYLLVMPSLGFPAATFGLLAAFVFLLGERRWWVVLGLALVATTLIYLGFARGLNVRLPLGVLSSLAR